MYISAYQIPELPLHGAILKYTHHLPAGWAYLLVAWRTSPLYRDTYVIIPSQRQVTITVLLLEYFETMSYYERS